MSGPPEDRARALLECVREVAGALHPRLAAPGRVQLDSAFDEDLGLDSLSRAELIARVERRFGCALPERVLREARSPRDLLVALDAGPAAPVAAPSPAPRAPQGSAAPVSEPRAARSLVEVVDWYATRNPTRTHLVYLEYDAGEVARESRLDYATLWHGARVVAARLRERSLAPGEAVAIMLPSGVDYFMVFLGVLAAGGVPVPIYPPARPAQLEDHVRRHAAILANAEARLLVTFERARSVARLLGALVEGLRGVVDVAELRRGDPLEAPVRPAGSDTAFLQYTSGSTGQPKGVVLSHDNLLANIRAMGEALGAGPEDVFVSWLPLYHDMGLIGAWMGSLYYAMTCVVMSPLAFLARPLRWLRAIQDHRGTLSGGPNFAFELCLRRLEGVDLGALDLSSWRYAFNGAEPVSAETIRRFTERFAPCGLRRDALAPVYGLAEATLGVAFTPPGRGPVFDRVERARLARRGVARPAGAQAHDAAVHVACGQPLPGYELRAVDEDGREVAEREVGSLLFRGRSTTAGYHRDPAQTRALFRDGWLVTGDRGYIAAGDVYVTGREKDVIIRAGRNLYPYEMEQAVGAVDGVRRGCVAVFAARSAGEEGERLVVVAETRERDPRSLERMRAEILALGAREMEATPDAVVLAPPHSVLKTSSGKIRRLATRERYERGELGAGGRAVWWQLARLGMAGLRPLARRRARSAARAVYAAFAWVIAGGAVGLAWVALAVLRGRERRWAFAGALARGVLGALGITPEVRGLHHLPRGPWVLAVNHQSYLDGLVLLAVLREPVAFVAKAELRGNFFARRLLEPLGVMFVERFDAVRGLQDTRALVAALERGERLAFFPEGTLRRMPGLLPFRMGAFMSAVQAGVPVVPAILHGTRSVLRDGQWFPRRAAIRFEAVAPVAPPPGGGAGRDFERALQLREAVRGRVLERCGEPDLDGFLPFAQFDS